MDLSKIYPQRPEWVHKGNFGNVLIVAGSRLYSGAATLPAIAALRAGCDMVTVCAPKRAADASAYALPDLMSFPLSGNQLSSRNINDILDTAHLRRVNAAVVGCGLDRKVTTFNALHKLIAKLTVPMVLDGDALRAIAQKPSSAWGKQVVLTPHAGELAILLNQKEVSVDFDARLVAAKQAAIKYHAVVLLKGFVDIITDGASTITNNSGVPFMTKGGFGDTLSGILGALLARGIGLFEAAHVAAYINGRAGEMAASEYGEGVMASDIYDFIPRVIKEK